MALSDQEEIEYLQLLEAERYETCKVSLSEFIRDAWHTIEPSTEYKPNWHIEVIAEYLTAVSQRQIKRLIINLPFRYGKSLLTSVFFPCWEWLTFPEWRWFFASYAQDLSTDLSLKRRRIIGSNWYQQGYGNLFKLTTNQDTKTWFENDKQGVMLASSVGGSVTGRGGDCLVVDDPIKAEEAFSAAHRKSCISWFDNTFATRLNDREKGAIVIIQHRVHPEDLTGHLLAKKLEEQYQYTTLTLPMVAEKDIIISYPISKKQHIYKEGDILWENKIDRQGIAALKEDIGSFGWNAQCQQNPQEVGGSMIKREWIKYYKELPAYMAKYQSWDTALEAGTANDYSVGITAVVCDNGYYITDVWRQKVEAPDLERAVRQAYNKEIPEIVLIEKKASGHGLIQNLNRTTRMPIKAIEPVRDKISRLNEVIGLFEAGKIFLPEGASWMSAYVEELLMFPHGAHDDQVDATTQLLSHARNKKSQSIFAISTALTTEDIMAEIYE